MVKNAGEFDGGLVTDHLFVCDTIRIAIRPENRLQRTPKR